MLIDWRKKRSRKKEKQDLADEPRTVEELRKENAELRNANEILKDAIGFFALDRRK